jgi:cytochrome c553
MPGIRRLVILGALLAGGGLIFAFSGIYSVAATKKHLAPVRLFFEIAMERSVDFHAAGISPPPLNDPDMIRLGAAHYEGGCAPCHGSPGRRQNPIAQQMMPEPPYLAKADEWDPAKLFWIVKHGIKYAGMPAWVAQTRDDEVWSVVAFLRHLESYDEKTYRKLAYGSLADPNGITRTQADDLIKGGAPGGITACARCHGLSDADPNSRAFPRLAIQSQDYLVRMLKSYRSGERASGVMQSVAAGLSDEQIVAAAAYYAGLPRAEAGQGGDQSPVGQAALGERIARDGTPAGVQACAVCHAPGDRAPGRPALAGQHASYLAQQLRLFRSGLRGGPEDVVMAAVAKQLTDQEIEAVSAHYARQPPDHAPAPARAAALAASAMDDPRHPGGYDVFVQNGCASCHQIRGTEARGQLGPDLTHIGSRGSLGAGAAPRNVGTLEAWIASARHIKPGTQMPSFGELSVKDLRSLAAYLDGLK